MHFKLLAWSVNSAFSGRSGALRHVLDLFATKCCQECTVAHLTFLCSGQQWHPSQASCMVFINLMWAGRYVLVHWRRIETHYLFPFILFCWICSKVPWVLRIVQSIKYSIQPSCSAQSVSNRNKNISVGNIDYVSPLGCYPDKRTRAIMAFSNQSRYINFFNLYLRKFKYGSTSVDLVAV